MASVKKRVRVKADGTEGDATYRVRWRTPEGQHQTQTFKRRREADRHARDVEKAKDAGTYIDRASGRTPLQVYAEEWRAARVGKPSTAEHVETTLRNHVYPAFGTRALADIRPSQVQAWVQGLGEVLAPSTVKVVHSHLSGIFAAAVADRLIPSNPCTGAKLPRLERVEVVPPTVAEVRRLAEAMPGPLRLAVVLGAELGVRQGEACGLTVDRVDFLRRQVRVDRQAVTLVGRPVGFGPPKTRVRTIAMPSRVAEQMAAHLERYGSGVDGVLLHLDDETMVSRQQLAQRVKRAAAKAKLPDGFTFHHLRHFYASALIASGASVKVIQAQLGHASAVETLDTYSHMWPTDDELVRTAIDTAFAR